MIESKIRSPDKLIKGFLHQMVESIVGEPQYKVIHCKLTTNATSVLTTLGGEQIDIMPVDPGPLLIIPAIITAAQTGYIEKQHKKQL